MRSPLDSVWDQVWLYLSLALLCWKLLPALPKGEEYLTLSLGRATTCRATTWTSKIPTLMAVAQASRSYEPFLFLLCRSGYLILGRSLAEMRHGRVDHLLIGPCWAPPFMYVFMYIHVYVYTYIRINIYIYIYICVYVCMCMYM